MGVHDGHRQRVKGKFIEVGADAFDDHNLLELLLFYSVSRRDTNELAHNLIKRFGSYSGVLEANLDELMNVDGVGENTAVLIKLVTEMNKRYMQPSCARDKRLGSIKEAGKYFVAKYAYETVEIAYAMFLDTKSRIISCREMNRGVVNRTNIDIRAIVEQALACKATSVIIAHNHPDGIPLPSDDDQVVTQKIRLALNIVGIRLEDHIIVGGDTFVSFADCDLIENRIM